MISFMYCVLTLGVACYNNNNYYDSYYDYNYDDYQDNDCAIRYDFECNNGTCISQSRICDGFRDCDRGEDEERYNCGGNSHSYNNAGLFNRYSHNNYRYSNRRYRGGIFNRHYGNDRYRYSNRRYGGDIFNRYYGNDRYSNRRYGADNHYRYFENDRYSNLKFGRREVK